MRAIALSATLVLLGIAPSPRPHDASPSTERVVVNDNTIPGGTLSNGELTIRLVVRPGEWHPDGDDRPGIVVNAFAEEGQPVRIPGPLIRVVEGTVVHAFVRNALSDSTLVVHGLRAHDGRTPADGDTVQIAPGAVREVRFTPGTPGTYFYWGTTTREPVGWNPPNFRPAVDHELSGAFIVDPRGTTGRPRDRVLVIGLWFPKPPPTAVVAAGVLLRFSINGQAWPNTERLAYPVGDTVRFRIVNASIAPHPMHLHGFYFNVESRGDNERDSIFDPRGSKHLVVTERVPPGRTFTMAWLPERAGYWLFHCHDNAHALRNRPFDGSQLPPEQDVHAHNHALEMMGGLVMGIEVRDRGVAQAAAEPPPRRHLRLVAQLDSGSTRDEPAYGYALQERGTRGAVRGSLLPAPTIVLRRGEPVSITVVNQLPEPTSVHWHGIELDSYYDGVADFSGHPGRVPRAIAPGDSFEARFSPPRSGTFIYHPHADELRQQVAGMSGPIVVVDDPARFDPRTDIVLLLTAPRRRAEASTIYLNGTNAPPPLDLRVGVRYRLRIVDIHPARPSMIMRVTRDSVPVAWRAIAKDGMDLPPDQATVRPAVQQMGNGETYDFEFTPAQPGDLRLTVSAAAGALLVSMPVRIR